jgi:hypothetical protein
MRAVAALVATCAGVLAGDRVVGSYLGPVSGTELTADIDTKGITLHVTGVVRACRSATDVGSALLPPGHYDLVATIEQFVGAQVRTLVTERRSIHLAG